MEQSSMTALVSLFARAYHAQNNHVKVFDDSRAIDIITTEEYEQISFHMTQGIGFFDKSFEGTKLEALRHIVNNYLAPSPLGRAAFAEKALQNAAKIGAEQYLILAAGFDTFAYRQPSYGTKLQIFEIDHPLTSTEKQKRVQRIIKQPLDNLHFVAADFQAKGWQHALLKQAAFSQEKISFCSMLGLCYYLSKADWIDMLRVVAGMLPQGSSLVFDYPVFGVTSHCGSKTSDLAKAANEEMKASYLYKEMEEILAGCGFLIYEHLTPREITNQFFNEYNQANPQYPMSAPQHVNYCLAVRQAGMVPI